MEEQHQQQGENNAEQQPEVLQPQDQPGSESDKSDVEKNKGIAIVAYFIFFLPLIAAKDSKFAMYHANQAFLLFLTAIVIQIVGSITAFILIGFIILPLGMLFVLVLFVIGIMNAARGEMKPLPLIGELFTILK